MTHTLLGRIQTRLALLVVVGLPWTLLVTPLLPVPGLLPTGLVYQLTLPALLLMGGLGCLWDGLYHALQQRRWDRDWPSCLGVVTAITEGCVLWLVLSALGRVPGPLGLSNQMMPAFLWQVSTTWLLLWLCVLGPMKVLLPRWRFRGGRLL
jgi:hypothetical protein